jgi:PPE-repeat protein
MLSKNNIGVASTLILVILLSQSRVFDFLIDTALGRFVLILFVLGISHMHKIFGVVAVLFIIIMINQSDMRFEGFNNTSSANTNNTSANTNNTSSATNSSSANAQEIQSNLQQKKQNIQNDLANQYNASLTSSSTNTGSTNTGSTNTSSTNTGSTNTGSTNTSDTFVGGREGFNMTDREGTILKGKRSNEIPVLSNSRTQTDDIEPSDKFVFTNSYNSV